MSNILALTVLLLFFVGCSGVENPANKETSSEQNGNDNTLIIEYNTNKTDTVTDDEIIVDEEEHTNNDESMPDVSHKYGYKVRGKRYKVFSKSKRFQEIGIASWYGPGFHGRKTANGERYDMHALTAAHKTLPLGCEVLVTNLENGNSVIVRINDRGPFHRGRIIDLSKKAAQELNMLKGGYTRVHVKSID